MLTPKEYAVDRGGAVCPNCENTEFESDLHEVDGTHSYDRITCTTCAAVWDNVFVLQYYDNLDLTNVE